MNKRTIKFRGKSKFGVHECLYGSLLLLNGKTYICPSKALAWNMTKYEVIPETAGQFTGLLDKNGKEIYEGDIVSINDFTNTYASPYIGKVIMRGGCWCVEYYKQWRCCPYLFFDDFADRKTEVVGNSHDNPELISQ